MIIESLNSGEIISPEGLVKFSLIVLEPRRNVKIVATYFLIFEALFDCFKYVDKLLIFKQPFTSKEGDVRLLVQIFVCVVVVLDVHCLQLSCHDDLFLQQQSDEPVCYLRHFLILFILLQI